jgi:aminopeptidase N
MMLAAFLTAFAAATPAGSAEQSPVVHHDLAVTLDPASHRLKVRDRIRIPGALVTAPLTIALNADLATQTISGGLKLVPAAPSAPRSDAGAGDGAAKPPVAVTVYAIDGATPGQDLTGELSYEGVINHAVRDSGGEYARAFAESPGLIEPRGVYLAGASRWVPQVKDALVTYTLTVELPSGWKSVSQGERTSTGAPERWSVATPAEEVHLIAAPFTEYSRDAGAVKAMAFLREPDQALAGRYLDATAQYLDMYNRLLGAYPYSKFALV